MLDSTPATRQHVSVYHDESGDFGHGEWAFVGMLWVRREDVAPLARELRALREPGAGEVHFYRFPRGFGGSYGATARTARAWFDLWRGTWLRRVWFNALAVQRLHPWYEARRYGRPEAAYRHFSGVCLRTGLEAFFAGESAVELAVCSDERAGANGATDGASTVALAAALTEAAGAGHVEPCPRVEPLPIPVRTLSGATTAGAFSDDQELLQLTDLLLGAASTAILPRGVAATKLWFAREMAHLMEQIRRPAGERVPSAHGYLLVSYFPDPVGRVYHDGQIGLWSL